MPIRTIAERLLQSAHDNFIGREDERALFTRALDAPELPFNVLTVHGPGGMGKSTLLQEYRFQCLQRGVECIMVDADLTDATPEAVLAALARELGLPAGADPIPTLAEREERTVLMIDTVEQVEPLHDWLGRWFVPRLSTSVLTVISGRTSLKPMFSGRPGWGSLVRAVALRNFSEPECRARLASTGLSDAAIDEILRFTLGHPLALALAESVAAQQPEGPLDLESNQDMIKVLLDRFVMHLPSPAHRAALDLSALARYTTEEMIAGVLGAAQGQALFAWLREQSFIHSGQRGLAPHELARRVLAEDVRWRNPEWFEDLHARLRAWYDDRLADAAVDSQQSIVSDYVYLYRHKSAVRPFYEALKSGGSWEAGLHLHAVSENTYGRIRDMIECHEGGDAATAADWWWSVQPSAFRAVLNANGELRGCMVVPELTGPLPDKCLDPMARRVDRYIAETAPMRGGETSLIIRWWMAADTYQQVSHVQMLTFIEATRRYLTTPGLAHTFFVCRDMDRWTLIFRWANLPPVEAVSGAIGDHRYGAFGHDWRVYPATTWLDSLAARDTGRESVPQPRAPDRLVLGREAFEEAVLEALRNVARPTRLTGNPLLRSALVLDEVNGDDTVENSIEVLCRILRDEASALCGTRSGDQAHRALDRTYFRPAPSQEAAAEALGVPYSTFRRHLSRGRNDLTERLWELEIAR